MTGRAYPLFEVAQMILAKPERHSVTFEVKKNAEGAVMQPLFVCALDETLWLSEAEAVDYVLNKHFGMFYQAEKTEIEPPKGTYTFVAQCGMSGTILGPPNHHDYQNQLHKLHSERFARMPFDMFKSKVRIVRDEEVIKKWVESQSWRTEFVCLNMPEPLRLTTMAQVEQHFRENHLANIIKQVESHTLIGTASRNIRCQPLQRLVRTSWDQQRRFPLQVATVLSQQFASRGLQFFKVNKSFTHVAVARPHFLDLDAAPVSDGIKRIVNFINEHPKCTRRHLLDALAPATVAPTTAPEPAPTAPAAEATGSASVETPAESAPADAPVAAAPAAPAISSEATAVIGDLHWLVHQGHVIEFANGTLETAKKPVPKPPKPAPTPASPEAAPVPTTDAATVDLSGEAPPPAPAEVPEAPAAETSQAVEEPAPEPEPTAQESAPLSTPPAQGAGI